jgi:hypothetical protein
MGVRNQRQYPFDAPTQDEAIKEGRGLAEEQNAELVIHGQEGRIREKDSHGNDPRNIPGSTRLTGSVLEAPSPLGRRFLICTLRAGYSSEPNLTGHGNGAYVR